MKYPRDLYGVDAVWIATDDLGQVALFTTGGEGPVPDTALSSVDIVEDLAFSLLETSGYNLLVPVPRPDDFIALAKRGLFAYDWSDVHRSARQASGRYELQAGPNLPLTLSDLLESLRALASATHLSGLSFGSSLEIQAIGRELENQC